MTSKFKTLAFTAAAVLLGGVLGTWVYNYHTQKTYRASVVVLLQDAGQRMGEALTLEAGLPAEGREGIARQLEQHAAAVALDVQHAKALDGAPDRKLGDATDAYLVTVREILRRQAASNRHRIALTASLEALRTHMRSDDRTGRWVTAAVRAREQVDADYREYRRTTEAYGTLLDTLAEAEKKIAPYVDASLLSDSRLIEAARRRTLDALGEAAAEMEQAKQAVSAR
jgi:hypothetical protein